MPKKYDFAGYVTKNDTRVQDGTIIRHGAFSENDNQRVPLIWEHDSSNPENVIGSIELVNLQHGVYGYGTFNQSEAAKHARNLVNDSTINAMSIGAHNIKRRGSEIIHGTIHEVSLVLAGANPGAMIQEVVQHGVVSDDKLTVFTDNIIHSATSLPEEDDDNDDKKKPSNSDRLKKTLNKSNSDRFKEMLKDKKSKNKSKKRRNAIDQLKGRVKHG